MLRTADASTPALRRCALWVLTAALLAGCSDAPLRLNEIQLVGSHNSYKQAIDPPLLAQLAVDNPDVARGLDYAHLPLAEQLDLGLRKLELDVFHDPEGGRYAAPLGIRTVASAPFDPTGVMNAPGFKVLHVQDIDFRSHCLLLADCLAILRDWSEAHPRHVPIIITINAKDAAIDNPDFVVPLAFDGPAFDMLDAELRAGFGDRLIVPDHVRGTFDSLERAVLERGWPPVDALRGHFLVVLDEPLAKLEVYASGHPSLAGRAMFANFPEGRAEAAVRIVNDPLERFDYIQMLVRQGYLVRTRADADTVEARTGDTRRRDAAFESGAQIVSTDYYVPDTRFQSGFVVSLPGGGVARCNPVLTASACRISE